MNKLINRFLFSLFVLAAGFNFNGVTALKSKTDNLFKENSETEKFRMFIQDIKKLNSILSFGDTLAYNNLLSSNTNRIDDKYVVGFELTDLDINTEYKIQEIKDFDCRFIGIADRLDCFLVFTTSYTTTAGDGNPVLMVHHFSENGELIDKLRFRIYYYLDIDIEKESLILVGSDFHFTLIDKTSNFKIDKDKRILLGTDIKTEEYIINANGKFEKYGS